MWATCLLFFTLWMITVFTPGLGCPELCTCSDKYGRHVAECSFRDLTEVPEGFHPNVTTISLSANKITSIRLCSFDSVTQVISLWMANNKLVSIEKGSLTALVHLRNLDISHNKIVDFPWEDLQNLTSLQLLKMNNNEMMDLPKDAFSNLKDLRSLRLNNNKFITIAEGTFDGLVSLSYLQIFKNPFACTCSLDWLRDWISTTTVSVPEHNLIICDSPESFKGQMIVKLPESKCEIPRVTIQTQPYTHNNIFCEGSVLILTCEFTGNPKPLVMWSIHSKSLKQELPASFTEDDTQSNEVSLLPRNPINVFNNGTLIISHIRKDDSGNYSCMATNEFGRAEDSVSVIVVTSPKPTPKPPMSTTQTYTETSEISKGSIFDSVCIPDLKAKNLMTILSTYAPTAEIVSSEEATGYLPHGSKCSVTANTRYISSYFSNESMDDIKQYIFDFGVIALGVSEREATVRLNPVVVPRLKSTNHTATSTYRSLPNDNDGHPGLSKQVSSNSLYLCITADHKHSAVQWSRIKEGINTYVFSGLRPGTNYSLCLTYSGEDCEVQVLFTTRRRVPNLLIIISVSICLLTVSTVPLLGATCFHLVYKYRSKTYKLILKAKDQCQMERNLAASFNLHGRHTESQREINSSQLDEEEGEIEIRDGEVYTEESVMTESFSLSQCKANSDNCEVGSDYSDRLPLGAEAVNIMSNYKYPNQ